MVDGNHLRELMKRLSFIDAEITMLREERDNITNEIHNLYADGAVEKFRDALVESATAAELKFKHIAELKGLNLKFQHKIETYVKGSNRINKIYFADFCDTKYKLVFEVDGGYHTDPKQKKLDDIRTRNLRKSGYKVFRITNDEIFEGKTSAFLYNAYKTIGIDITHKTKSGKFRGEK